MLCKNRNRRVGRCVTVVTSCLILVSLCLVLAMPGTTLAGKPDKPDKPDKPGGGKPGNGGGGEVGQEIAVCLAFDDADGDGIKTDGDAYCDGDEKKKVTAIVGRNISIVLNTNNSNKRTAGRTLWLDLSRAVGCEDSVKVDVSDGAGGDVDGICDDCLNAVPDLPTVRFGTLVPGQKRGYPDSASLEILGRDLDGLLVGDWVATNARLKFSVGGEDWILHWGPHTVPGGWTYAPGTAPVTVTRDGLDVWRVVSIGEACLYRNNNRPHRATEYYGQVTVPFAFTAVAMEPESTVWGDKPHGIVLGEPPCVE